MPGVFRRVPVVVPARRGVKLRQFEPSVALRDLHHRDLRPGRPRPANAVQPTALDRPSPCSLSPIPTKNASRPLGRRPRCPRAPMRWMRSTVATRQPQQQLSLGCRSATGSGHLGRRPYGPRAGCHASRIVRAESDDGLSCGTALIADSRFVGPDSGSLCRMLLRLTRRQPRDDWMV
jgi:hypothetical protein